MDDHLQPRRAAEVFAAFLVQGLTAFGGPTAHVGYFRREFVERRGWVSAEAFGELLALCQFLPGPASSQLGMAIGLRRAGLAGALAAWIGFSAPAAAAMIALAYGAPTLVAAWGIGWLHGLKLAAAAVVLQAVLAMARSLAAGPVTGGIAIGAAVGLVLAQGPLAPVAALAAGGAFGLAFLRRETPPVAATAHRPGRRRWAIAALALFILLLIGLPALGAALADPTLAMAGVFYRTGALVFGGGHTVLPLLQAEVVGRGWLPADAFLAGYGAVQAVPGPLFSFAAYVGAAQRFAPGGWAGGLVALIAIYAPSLLLVLGVLPFWDRLKARAGARAALAGVNAAVVGVLAAALWDPVLKTSVRGFGDIALVAAAFVLLTVVRLPPWAVVIGMTAAVGLVIH
jgi:chromate transporter